MMPSHGEMRTISDETKRKPRFISYFGAGSMRRSHQESDSTWVAQDDGGCIDAAIKFMRVGAAARAVGDAGAARRAFQRRRFFGSE